MEKLDNSIILKNKYLHIFNTKNEKTFGFRYGISDDVPQLIKIFEDIYQFNYLYPKVYNEKKFRECFLDPNQTWFIVEKLDTKEIVGTGVMEKKSEISVNAGKTVIKNNYQGYGLAQGLGSKSVFSFLSRPDMKNVIRLDTDIRANNASSQKFAEKIRCIPYGFIPNYNIYGDKRSFDVSKGLPFNDGVLESVVMYFSPIKNFWKMRNHKINLLNNDMVMSFYELVKKNTVRMNHDNISIENRSYTEINEFKIVEDPYKSCVYINGCLNRETLEFALKKYSNWNVIEWRVPTTIEGINSQQLAVEHNFKVIGYDPGSLLELGQTTDTILFGYFPRGVFCSQFKELDVLESTKPIVNQVLDSIDDILK